MKFKKTRLYNFYCFLYNQMCVVYLKIKNNYYLVNRNWYKRTESNTNPIKIYYLIYFECHKET